VSSRTRWQGPIPSAEPGRSFLGVFRYLARAARLAWSTNRLLTLGLAAFTVLMGALPAAVAWIGAAIVDAVVSTMRSPSGFDAAYRHAMWLVGLEGVTVALLAGAQRGQSTCQSLLRAELGQRVNAMILEKALTLDLSQFEDSEFYDKLTRARREASTRPLSMVMRTFSLTQNVVTLASFSILLAHFSAIAVVLLLIAGLPVFFAEAKFSGEAFRLFQWRSPETRRQLYLESALSSDAAAKEVKLFGLGPLFLQRYRDIYHRLYREDRALTLRRDAWGFGLGLVATGTLYGAYAWIASRAMLGTITLGAMTMYLALFRQGQSALSAALSSVGGLYEDNLYLSNLYDYLDHPVPARGGSATSGPDPTDGIRFEGVSFHYPDAQTPALSDIRLHIRPGESLALVGENGSGKTTLIKLLTRLYPPTEGRIVYEGRDLAEWSEAALHDRIGVIFQDFTRYQMKVGENIGAGDVTAFEDRERWAAAASQGLAEPFIRDLPEEYDTQLGKWFRNGRELSGGQWQKIALARAFMRSRARVLVLDEPTAAMDAGAEAEIFTHFRTLTRDRIAILISHRFSTVRMADRIAVLDGGRIVEYGSHDELMALGGRYAHLFTLQARGYR
jgi:ATP-binding cassette, subfamily B, bacterial